jgi:hypothetical protein
VPTTIVVRSQREIAKGSNDKGPWTMYSIEAERADGTFIADQLKTFESLPLDEAIEVEVTPRHSEKYGTSYTVKPCKGGQIASSGAETSRDHERRITDLEERMGALEAQSAPF